MNKVMQAISAAVYPGFKALILTVLTIALLAGSGAMAQVIEGLTATPDNSGSEAEDSLSLSSITARITALEAERNEISTSIEDGSAEGIVLIRREKLDRLERLLAMQLAIATELSNPANATESPSVENSESVFALNSLYEDLDATLKKIEDRRSNLAAARDKLAAAKKELSALKIAQGAAAGPTDSPATEQLLVARYAVRIATEEEHLARLEVRESGAGAGSEESYKQAIKKVRSNLAQSTQGAEDAIERLTLRIANLARQENSANSNTEMAELRLAGAQARLSSSSIDPQLTLAQAKTLASLRDVTRERVSLYALERDRLEGQKEIWRNWSALLAGSASRQELHSWAKAATKRLESLRLDESQAQGRAAELKARIDLAETKMLEAEPDSPLRELHQEMASQLEGLQSELLSLLRGLGFDQRLTKRLLDDIQAEIGGFNLFEWGSKSVDVMVDLWNWEITTIDDAPFTLGSLAIGLLLFTAGVWISRRVSTALGRMASDRFKLHPGAAHAIQSLSFYAMLVGISLLALRTIHFPLTAFAFLGGALAIGIGFGSQNVMNNFISGLILMLERPVRAADVVEVDGNHGTIEKIGARSTQIRSNDGRHIVVPNSFFLESNVINWTLSDELIRAKVSVGVAYGSPTEQVDKLIDQVVNNHKEVLKQPKPIIIFESFGDNSLNFEAHFWVSARSPMGVKQIESKIRFAIDAVFRDHDIVIAFPQRDVHLDSLSPIDIRMVSSSKDEKSQD